MSAPTAAAPTADGGIVMPVTVRPTPEQVAAMFWELGSDEQADFFAALHRTAGINLCFQMAWVVREISERSGRGDYEAWSGFRVFADHAEDYIEAATSWRIGNAKAELSRLAALAKAGEQ